MNISNQYLEQSAEDTFSVMGKYLKTTESFRKSFAVSKSNISVDNINFCLEKFLFAEFDFKTSGSRGLGRLTEACPRLGAYFRGTLSKLDEKSIQELDTLITNLIIRSYLFPILTSSKLIKSSALQTSRLYEKWIPKIYVFSFDTLPEEFKNLLSVVIQNDYEAIENFFRENNMKPGFLAQDKISEILTGYIAAGLMLRACEEF